MVKLETNGIYKRFRFSYNKKRYALYLSSQIWDNPNTINTIRNLLLRDIKNNNLDTTLERYKTVSEALEEPIQPKKSTVTKLFRQFMEAKGIVLESSFHHYGTFRMLEKLGKTVTLDNLPNMFSLQVMSASVFNKRKTHLKLFYDWLVRIGWLSFNPITDLKSRRLPRKPPDNHLPFSIEEIVLILNALKNNTYCVENNQFKHSHYYFFVKFIFHTGVRVGEAVVLNVQDLDLQSKTASIRKAYGATQEKWKKTKVIKAPKGDSSRTIQLTDEIVKDLSVVLQGKKLNDLVFPGPRNKIIDSKNFNVRVFYPVLDGLNIPRRVIYAGRHTYASLAVQQQANLADLKQQLGHDSINTTIKYYTLFKGAPKVNIVIPPIDQTC